MFKRIFALLALPMGFNAEQRLLEEDSSLDAEQGSRTTLTGEVMKKLVSISQPITLTCGKPGDDLLESISWFYKACGVGASDRPCDLSKDVGGQKMCRGTDEDPCPVNLIVQKPQPGLYRCYKTGLRRGYTMTATLVSTYQLNIIERKLEPEFIELPEDVDAFAGSSALFMCRIKSNLPLHVKWYKRVLKSPAAIQYENKFYQGMNGTSTVKDGDVYTSKLKFKTVDVSDTGEYACGAINEAGIQYREVRLIVTTVTMHVPPRAPVGPWKMTLFGSAGGFLAILVTSLCCARLAKSSCKCKKDGASARRSVVPPPPRRQYPRPVWTPEPETSDYEHVVTL